jgi:hypothetical protein
MCTIAEENRKEPEAMPLLIRLCVHRKFIDISGAMNRQAATDTS